ncbi:hypothetical protein Avbf_08330 [Armadillidium vulgare]|nr:hypothetical protein Avbf_08330 [Armadillidium vulgare]
MNIKHEKEFNIEFVKCYEEDDDKTDIHLEQLSTFEQIQESNCFGSIDMKNEIEVKEEPFDIGEEEAENDELERDCYGSIDTKSEIDVKEEPFAIREEEATNDELSDKIFQLDPIE